MNHRNALLAFAPSKFITHTYWFWPHAVTFFTNNNNNNMIKKSSLKEVGVCTFNPTIPTRSDKAWYCLIKKVTNITVVQNAKKEKIAFCKANATPPTFVWRIQENIECIYPYQFCLLGITSVLWFSHWLKQNASPTQDLRWTTWQTKTRWYYLILYNQCYFKP